MKRVLVSLLCMVMILSTFCVAPIAYAADNKVIFEDDFSMEAAGWKIKDGPLWMDNKLNMTSGGWGYAYIGDYSFKFYNPYTAEFDVKLTGDITKPEWTWIAFDAGNVKIYFKLSAGTCYVRKGTADGLLGSAPIEKGKNYRFKVMVTQNAVAIQYKEEGGSYKDIGATQMPNALPSVFDLHAAYTTFEVDNFVITSNGGDVVPDAKVKYLTLDKTEKITLSGSAAAGCTFESSDPEAVTVSADGTLKALKVGSSTINIKNAAGDIVESVFAKVAIPPESISFNYNPKTSAFAKEGSVQYNADKLVLGVGERCDLRTYMPSDTTLKGVNWSADKDGIVDIYLATASGITGTITALNVGETVVTAQSKYSDVKAQLTVQVIPKEDLDKTPQGTYTFYPSGQKDSISPMLVGAHVQGANPTMEEIAGTLNDLNLGSMRTSSGFINDSMVGDGETVGSVLTKASNASGIPIILCIGSNMVTDPEHYDEDIAKIKKMVQDFKDSYRGDKLYIELFNEMYGLSKKNWFPTVEDYVDMCQRLITELKTIAPDAKYMVSAYGPANAMEYTLAPNGDRQEYLGDPAYTETARITLWDEMVRDELINKGYADAVTVHPYYVGGSHWNGMSGRNNIRARLALVEEAFQNDCYNSMFFGKDTEFYYTECGTLEILTAWGLAASPATEWIKYNYQKYPLTALFTMRCYLQYMKQGNVEAANFHALLGNDGWGIVEELKDDRGYLIPNEVIFKKLGATAKKHSTFYGMNSLNMDYDTSFTPFRNTGSHNWVSIANVEAYAFGDESNINEIAFFNQTDVPQKVKLEGATLKPNWSYGGEFDEVMPEWLKNESWGSKYTLIKDYKNAEVYTRDANKHEGAQFAEEIEIPPYTILFADVEGTPKAYESTGDKINRSLEYCMRDSVVLNVGNSTAYVDNRKTVVDENPAVTPIVENDRTLLPLRFVAESLGCDVAFDDATQEITVKNAAKEIKLTLGQTAYTVNGEAKEFDVPAYEKDGRTLLPLRALAEALGRSVYWDDRGYIFVGRPTNTFNVDTPLYFDEIEKLFV